jgi:hypothetical protein
MRNKDSKCPLTWNKRASFLSTLFFEEAMKKISFSPFLAIIFALTIMISPMLQSQQVSYTNVKDAAYLAKDSSLADAGTKVSQPITMFAKTSKLSTSVNYLHGATITIYGSQTNDSVHALIYLRVGQITGGTAKSTYGDVLVDSLTLTKNFVQIQLTNYKFSPEIAVKVVGSAAGNGYLAKWSAQFNGAGIAIIEK